MKEQKVNESKNIFNNKYLVFNIDKYEYCIEFKFVKEIIKMMSYTSIPNLPDYYKGAINLRGQVIPIMDLGLRLNSQEIVDSERTCIIIVEHELGEVGLIVDVVTDVFNDIDANQVVAVNNEQFRGNKFISGVINTGKSIVYVLSLKGILE